MNRAEFETVMIQNPAAAALAAMGLASAPTSYLFHPSLRDDSNTRVFRDKSGVIFLERALHDEDWYRAKGADRDDVEAVRSLRDRVFVARPQDDVRRFRELESLVRGQRLCDYWMGTGGFAEKCIDVCREISGVDVRAETVSQLRQRLSNRVIVEESIDNLRPGFDVITLFHVLDRTTKPVSLISKLHSCLRPGGHLVVEVPNATNALIEDVDLPAYRDFIFSSEELVMFTRDTLQKFLAGLGFTDVTVKGVQRYSLAVHAGWLLDGQPVGEDRYGDRATPENTEAYNNALIAADRSDTLFAIARKPLV